MSNNTGTLTGRLSSSKLPQQQQVPIRTEEGRLVRVALLQQASLDPANYSGRFDGVIEDD